LATGRSRRALIDHAADGRRERWVPDSVQNDLSDRALAVRILGARLIIDGARETLQRLAARRRIALEHEGPCSRIGSRRNGNRLVDLERLLGRDLLQEQWGRRRRP